MKQIQEAARTVPVIAETDVLDTDMFKFTADRMVLESGVRPLLHRNFVEYVNANPESYKQWVSDATCKGNHRCQTLNCE